MADMIGFIGVGTMGEPMCRNLERKSGLTVLAADRDEAPLARLAADGVKGASLDEIAGSCRTIFLSLPAARRSSRSAWVRGDSSPRPCWVGR